MRLSKANAALLAFVAPLGLLSIWHIASRSGSIDHNLLPTPASVVSAAKDLVLSGALWTDLKATLARMTVGFLLAVLVGVPLGLLMGSFRPIYCVLTPVTDFFRSIPVTALYPIFVLFAGIDNASKIGMVFLACVNVIALNSAYGVIHSSEVRRQMALLYGATRFQTFRLITLPEAFAQTVVGLRVAVSLAMLATILCEMFMGAKSGLGQRITESFTTYKIAEMVACIFTAGLLGVVLNRLLESWETRCLLWKRT